MRSAPESSSRDENFSALRPDLRQRMPAVVAGSLTIRALSHDVRRKKKRKRNAEQRGSVSTASFDAARALQSALAIRRSTTALCQWDYSSQGSTWARLRDTPAHAAVPRQPVWHFQRCTSRAGHSAGRLMPRPPGNGSDEPPPAGTASRSDQPGSPADVLHGERD
jgi:hypothetical protein